MSQTNQSWGGRFTQPTNEFVQLFNASIDFDRILAPFDIKGSIAHATMLGECGIIELQEKDQIIKGLTQVLSEIENGDFIWSYSLEDVHMNIESRLVEIIGDTGKKLHTGRSRNDQVATDIRLYLLDKIDVVIGLIESMQSALVKLAEQHTTTIMPGFTHLQAAQPVSFAHHLMAYYEMLERDKERFNDARIRTNTMPLGSAALAGTTYPIDREITAKLLGLPYPGGPYIEKLAKEGNHLAYKLPVSMVKQDNCNFSLSGLKTAVRYLIAELGELSLKQKEDIRNARKHIQTTSFDIHRMPEHNDKINSKKLFSKNTPAQINLRRSKRLQKSEQNSTNHAYISTNQQHEAELLVFFSKN